MLSSMAGVKQLSLQGQQVQLIQDVAGQHGRLLTSIAASQIRWIGQKGKEQQFGELIPSPEQFVKTVKEGTFGVTRTNPNASTV